MSDKIYDFQIVFTKLAELNDQLLQEKGEIELAEVNEFDEIRALREIVLEIQSKPQIYFAST